MARLFLMVVGLMVAANGLASVIREDTMENNVMREKRSIIKFCKWPQPYNLSRIQPTFWAHTRKFDQQFNVSTSDEIGDMIVNLKTRGQLAWGRKVVFIIHGFQNNVGTAWLADMANALKTVEDSLIFTVGWGKGADLPDYPQAASNTQTMASAIASAVMYVKEAGIHYVYCIGHSLGAQICGQAGMQIGIERISGLDPAGPGFDNCSHIALNQSSADCVDVIHTNGDWEGYGTVYPAGHIDFYPNCGHHQPSCGIDLAGCSHGKAIDYFIESINAFAQPSTKCPLSQGPCDNKFRSQCRPCNNVDGCLKSQPHCETPNTKLQAIGYGSVCHERKKPPCISNQLQSLADAPDTYQGQWYVPVDKDGIMPYV